MALWTAVAYSFEYDHGERGEVGVGVRENRGDCGVARRGRSGWVQKRRGSHTRT